jgi:uncharacterized protein YdaU (DUF1376 family)
MSETKDSKPTANTAYTAATAALREKHRDEFDVLLAEKRAEMGLAPVHRRTPEQVAADKVKAAEIKAAAKAAAAREKALAAAQALALEYPDLVVVKAPSLDEVIETIESVPGGDPGF